MEYMFSILLENTAMRKRKKLVTLNYQNVKLIVFARAITTSKVRASSVSPSSYTNTIFNQSARVLS